MVVMMVQYMQRAMHIGCMNSCARRVPPAVRTVLLTGQMGNLGLSWPGDRSRHSTTDIRHWLRSITPFELRRGVQRQRLLRSVNRSDDSAIHPDLARCVHVVDANRENRSHPLYPPISDNLLRRTTLLGAGRQITGALLAEQGAAFGLSVCDPTADIRLLCYCLAVPPHLFIDQESGLSPRVDPDGDGRASARRCPFERTPRLAGRRHR